MTTLDDKNFQKCINKCNKNINKVFKIYSDLLNGIFSWQNFIDFQNILIETLYEEKSQEIPLRQTLKKINNGSDTINNKSLTIKKIEELETIENSVKILGDFLCWIFYMNDFELMDKHIEKPHVGMNSVGSGVVAEIEAIKKLNVSQNPHFYLYNELSSFLRIGDLSVFDKQKGKIIGFGEIKSSKPQNNIIDISVDFIVNSKNLYVPDDLEHKENQGHDFLNENMKEHLEKQLCTMKESLTNKKKVDKHIQQEVNIPHHKDLEKLINKCHRNGSAVLKISNDILYLSVKNKSEEIDFKDVFDKEHVLEILTTNPIKGQNNITFSKLNLLSYGKNIPFLFLPISNSAKKKALNQTIFIIFNYNSVIDYFYKQGFTFVKKKKVPYLEKKLEKEIISLCLLSIHEIYINMFLDEISAIDIINKMLNESKDGNGNRHIFMNMKYIKKRDKN